MPKTKDVKEALLEYVNKTDTCWLWTTTINRQGYGSFSLGQRRGISIQAHRVSYTVFKGAIPEGLQIDHLCRVRSCVNPDHLEAVTQEENARRRKESNTHCPQGHEYSEKNVYSWKGLRKECRICHKDREFKRRGKLNSKV